MGSSPTALTRRHNISRRIVLTLVLLAVYYMAAHWLGGWPLVGLLLLADFIGGSWPLALVASLGYLAYIGNWMGAGLVAGFALVCLVVYSVYLERRLQL